MLADFLSNFLQHPTQKMDYGAANQLIGREIDSKWWGTRIEHIVGVAACLAVVDHFSQGFFSALVVVVVVVVVVAITFGAPLGSCLNK